MPIPVELDEIEGAIRTLNQRLVTLKTASRDIVVGRNKLALALQQQEVERDQLVAQLRGVLGGEVIDMWAYDQARGQLELAEDRLFDGRMKLLEHEQKLKAVHDEIPTVEQLLRSARAERAEWGEVIPFGRQPG